MKEINFQEVGMENFGPYIDPMLLSFTNNLLVLMRGPNGIGKTMALDALPFTLYGETSKKAKGDDVVNNRIGKNCHTWTKFTVDDDKYAVNRYHKYTKYGNTVVLNKNGVDIKKGQREVLPEIEKLICPKKSFMNTLMFGQKVKDFFTDLLDSDKKEIFRKILDLAIYTLYYKKADDQLKESISSRDEASTLIQIEQGVLDEVVKNIALQFQAQKQYENDKKVAIVSHNKTIKECDRMLENWEMQLAELKIQDHDIESIATEMSSLLGELDSSTQQRQTEINQLHALASQKESEISKSALEAKALLQEAYQKDVDIAEKGMREFLQQYQTAVDDLTKDKSETTAEISSWETTMYMSENQRTEFQQSIDEESVCPTCLRDMDDDCIGHLQDEVNDLSKTIKDHETKIINAKANVDFIHKQMQNETKVRDETKISHATRLKEYETIRDHELLQVKNRLEAATLKVKEFETETTQNAIDECEVRNVAGQHKMEELIERKSEIEKVLEKINEADTSINNIKQNKEWTSKEIQKLEETEYDDSQLKEHQRRKLQLEVSIQQNKLKLIALDSKIELNSFWKSAFSSSGIPSMLIDEAIPFMNLKVMEYLDKITNGRYIVSFDTMAATKTGEFRDKISVHVLDTHTGADSRVQLSGGQTRIIDIATILTLGDLQSTMQDVRINIMLFDEIFDALDDENIGYVSKVLSKLKIDKSIYVISHSHVDQLEADEVLVMN